MHFGGLVEGSRLFGTGLLLEKWLARLSFIGKCIAGHYLKGRSPNGLLGLTPRHYPRFWPPTPFSKVTYSSSSPLVLDPFTDALLSNLINASCNYP